MKAARRERLLTRSLLVGICATFAVMVATTLVSRDSLRQQRKAMELVTRTQGVLRALEGIAASLYRSEAAQRALVLMNDESYAPRYLAATKTLTQLIDEAKLLVVDNPPQVNRMQRLAELAQERLVQLEGVIAANRELGLAAARQELARTGNKRTSAAMAELVARMEAEESRNLEARLEVSRVSYRRAQRLNILRRRCSDSSLWGASSISSSEPSRSRQLAVDEIERHRETLRVTLVSIGDAVITTDSAARVTLLNREAERLTGWTTAEAAGRPLDQVFAIANETSRLPVENPAHRALREGMVVGPENHTSSSPRTAVKCRSTTARRRFATPLASFRVSSSCSGT